MDGEDLLVDNTDSELPEVSTIEVIRGPQPEPEDTTVVDVGGVDIQIPTQPSDEEGEQEIIVIETDVDENGVVCIKDESGECKETTPISDVDVELPASDE